MKLEICLKSFALAVVYLSLAVALTSGKVQEFIKFNSVDAEMFAFILSSGMGIACLVASLKLKR
jgi:hypothetical protein